jgi:hypothetical protein
MPDHGLTSESEVSAMRHSNTTLASYAPLFRSAERPSAQQTQLSEILALPGSWGREARAALGLAGEHGVRLDVVRLVYSDVRDLISLQHALRQLGASAASRHLPRELRPYLQS